MTHVIMVWYFLTEPIGYYYCDGGNRRLLIPGALTEVVMPSDPDHDLFLSYNSLDHLTVLEFRPLFEARHIKSFLDRDNLIKEARVSRVWRYLSRHEKSRAFVPIRLSISSNNRTRGFFFGRDEFARRVVDLAVIVDTAAELSGCRGGPSAGRRACAHSTTSNLARLTIPRYGTGGGAG
jgi:hypothetical protein